ncbi:MAG: hypothetical protein AAF628_20700 [Planctomycetota bacterium]
MVSQRFLGAEWAAVHGPAEAAVLPGWALDRGFVGLSAGPAPRAVDWRAVRLALDDLPASITAVRAASVLEPPRPEWGSLASARSADQGTAMQRLTGAVRLAEALGCPRVLIEPGWVAPPGERGVEDLADPNAGWTPDRAAAQLARRNVGRDAGLDRVCRALFKAAKSFPGIEFCLIPGRSVLSLGDPDGLSAIFEDLPRQGLRYWHDASLAALRADLLQTPQGEWLERFSNLMVGMTLADSGGGSAYLPPGAGGVDYPLLASYRRRLDGGIPVLVELDLAVDLGEVPGIHAFLDKYAL